MSNNRRFLPLVLFLALAHTAPSFARGQFWNFLGDTQVSGNQDHVDIPVSRTNELLRAIQLRVTGQALFFDRMVVHFAGGTSQEFIINGRIQSGRRDYVVAARGESRTIERVELRYYREPSGHNARVSLYGILVGEPVESAARTSDASFDDLGP